MPKNQITKKIEIGHIFYFGQKYKSLNAIVNTRDYKYECIWVHMGSVFPD